MTFTPLQIRLPCRVRLEYVEHPIRAARWAEHVDAGRAMHREEPHRLASGLTRFATSIDAHALIA